MKTESIMVCADCILFIANGDLPSDSSQERDDAIVDGVTRLNESGDECNSHVVAGDTANDNEFSWRACECCQSHLGGSRHEAIVVTPEPATGDGLEATVRHGQWVVVDPNGGVWFPHEPVDTGEQAIELCRSQPMEGEWFS